MQDATWEATVPVLAQNARGVLGLHDELLTLILGMNQYENGRGSDRANFNAAWSGAAILVDRKSHEFHAPIRVPHPRLSVVGNMPSDLIRQMIHPGGDDGFLDRWLIVWPDPRPRPRSSERGHVSDAATAAWKATIDALWSRQMRVHEGRVCPHVLRFTGNGRREYDRLYDGHVDEVNAGDFSDSLRGGWSKLETYSGRFALDLALLWHAVDPTADHSILPGVTTREATDSWRLINYFKVQCRRARAFLEGRGEAAMPDGARWATNWIRNHPGVTTFTRSDLSQTYAPSRGYHATDLEDGLAWLESRHAIRRVRYPGERLSPGRKPAPSWKIHPDFLAGQGNQGNPGPSPARGTDSPDSPDGEEEAEWSA
jgi:hypothetical protein